jgi:hypothetical protein
VQKRYARLADLVLDALVRAAQTGEDAKYVGQRVAAYELLPQLEVRVKVGGDRGRVAQEVADGVL